MPEILLVGQDLKLLATRAAVLAELGARIEWGTPRMIEPALGEKPINLLVLCHTLPLRERQELVARAGEKSPGTEILQLVSTIELRDVPLLPNVKIGVCDPIKLVRRVEELLGESLRSHHPAGHRSAYRRAMISDLYSRKASDLGTFEGGLFSR